MPMIGFFATHRRYSIWWHAIRNHHSKFHAFYLHTDTSSTHPISIQLRSTKEERYENLPAVAEARKHVDCRSACNGAMELSHLVQEAQRRPEWTVTSRRGRPVMMPGYTAEKAISLA